MKRCLWGTVSGWEAGPDLRLYTGSPFPPLLPQGGGGSLLSKLQLPSEEVPAAPPPLDLLLNR